jgi:hypothetical protein
VINYGLKQEAFVDRYFRLGTLSSKGWRQNLTGCPYCNDGKSRNPRSHFLFSNDEIGWQCFNCSKKHRFNGNNLTTFATFISKSAWKKMGSILLEIKKEKIFLNSGLKDQEDIKSEVGSDNFELINYKEVELPDVSIKYDLHSSKVSPAYRKRFKDNKSKVKAYLKERGLSEIYKTTDLYICMVGEYNNRLIFPIYFDDKLVSWAARALFPTKNKYLYPPSNENFNNRGTIIYGLDKLFKTEDVKQIFVTESINDAIHLNGMAVLSKNITTEQLEILKHFNFQNKKLVFVLDNDTITKFDKDLKGGEMGKIIFKEKQSNWFVSLPKFGTNIKDVSESILKNGILETYDRIMSGFVSDFSNMKLKIQLKSTGLKKMY